MTGTAWKIEVHSFSNYGSRFFDRAYIYSPVASLITTTGLLKPKYLLEENDAVI